MPSGNEPHSQFTLILPLVLHSWMHDAGVAQTVCVDVSNMIRGLFELTLPGTRSA